MLSHRHSGGRAYLFSLSLEGEGWGEGEIVETSNIAYIGETPPP